MTLSLLSKTTFKISSMIQWYNKHFCELDRKARSESNTWIFSLSKKGYSPLIPLAQRKIRYSEYAKFYSMYLKLIKYLREWNCFKNMYLYTKRIKLGLKAIVIITVQDLVNKLISEQIIFLLSNCVSRYARSTS